MNKTELKKLLAAGEWSDVEFIEARTSVPRSAYETVAAFANTHGGHLVLGVAQRDHSFEITGVEAQEAQVEAQEAQVELANWQLSILAACATGDQTGKQLLEAAGYKTRTGNFKKGLQRLVEQRLIEYTIPDRPNSRLQKYRLTQKGRQAVASGHREREAGGRYDV